METATKNKGGVFVETATKKRGRPKKIGNKLAEQAFYDMEPRAAQNMFYAGKALIKLEGESPDPEIEAFFLTRKGNYRKQGILEQLGRMLEEGSITNIEDGRNILRECMENYKEGESVKTIEKRLRMLRKLWKEGKL